MNHEPTALARDFFNSLLGKEDAANHQHLTTLNASYDDYRKKAFHLTSHIASSLPSLTIHDGTHLDALWETADLIAGPNYPLNPLEGYVLGGAILLHDSALCFEAYHNGLDGLRSTIQWKDVFSGLKELNDDKDETLLLNDADFDALRQLHAKQAEALAEAAWELPSKEKVFLIENGELRRRFGRLIGEIAASHYWPIEDLSKLGNQVNAPGFFPIEWRVDPIKIACILRCADAAHIDDRRAPDFLHALTRRQGISAEHWQAQNWLARADIDQSDPNRQSLLITSNHEFDIDNSNAWWIAYDTIALIESEIRSSNALLSSRTMSKVSPPFKITNVVGANNPDLLSRQIRVSGWRPCSAEIHVSNVENLVKSLGGAQLYGNNDQLDVSLRELIQNARDAIIARQELDQDYKGKIRVRICEFSSDVYAIQIEDDGVGMSERVLTGPLLDFGNSFWISNLVRDEFPGLRSSNFAPVGKFGIGFYSVFTISNEVTLSTRRWTEGINDVKTLRFPNGLTLRPILSNEAPSYFSSGASTIVRLTLNRKIMSSDKITIRRSRIGEANFDVDFSDYLSAIVCGLDVTVEFFDNSIQEYKTIHSPIKGNLSEDDKLEWLKKISFYKYDVTGVSDTELESESRRMRFVDNERPNAGLAALSYKLVTNTDFLYVNTIGGLASNIHSRSGDRFIGFIDHEANTAKREATTRVVVSQDKLQLWVNEQIEILKSENVDEIGWAVISSNICQIGLDPYDIFRVIVIFEEKVYCCDLQQLFSLTTTRGLALFEFAAGGHIDIHNTNTKYENFPVFKPIQGGNFLSISKEFNENDYSMLGCLRRYAKIQGFGLNFTYRMKAINSALGKSNIIIVSATPLDE